MSKRPLTAAQAIRHMKRLGTAMEPLVTEAKRLGYDGFVLFALRTDDTGTAIYRQLVEGATRPERIEIIRRLDEQAAVRFTSARRRRELRQQRDEARTRAERDDDLPL